MSFGDTNKVGVNTGANPIQANVDQTPAKARKRGLKIVDSYSTIPHGKSAAANNPTQSRQNAISLTKELKGQLGVSRRLLQGSTILGGIVSLPVFAAAPPFGLIPLLGAPIIGLIAQAFAKSRLHKNFAGKLENFGNDLVDAGATERAPKRPGETSNLLELKPDADGKVDPELQQAVKMHNFLQRSMWGDVKHDLISPVWSRAAQLVHAFTAKKPQEVTEAPEQAPKI